MTEKENLTVWEGELYRDTVTYRFVDLAVSALDAAFADDENLEDKYDEWLAGVEDSDDEEDAKPVILYEFSSDSQAFVRLFAVPSSEEFVVLFKSENFEVSVSMSYDLERKDVRAVQILKFEGDVTSALVWGEEFSGVLNDVLVSKMQRND